MWIETENQVAVDANEITAVRVAPPGHQPYDEFRIEFIVRGHTDITITYMKGRVSVLGNPDPLDDPVIREALDAAKAAVEAAKCHCRH